MKKALRINVLFFLFITQFTFAQLTDFVFSVTKTDETCSGNGAAVFSVSNTAIGATILYSLYQLPNITTPIAVTSTATITGLVAGDYRAVALQTLGNLSNTKQQDFQINSLIVPLSYQLSGQPANCLNGSIIVNVTQGNPVSYEIISGPVIVPPQSSNVLEGLLVGEYVVRVNDQCGDGIVQTFTLAGTSALTISPIVQSCAPVSCLITNAQVTISPAIGTSIYYPLTVETTIYPPDGGTPVVNSQIITSGTIPSPPNLPFATVDLSLQIVNDLQYSYTIRVTDACGGNFIYNGTDLIRIHSIELFPFGGDADHLSYITIKTCNLIPPFTVNFVQAPAGFNPSHYNSGHPGPFLGSPIRYESTPEHQLPFGTYDVEVTDSCGAVVPGHCSLGGCLVALDIIPVCSTFGKLQFRFITELIITSAPASFPFPLPYTCTSQIVDHEFTIQVPLGNYSFSGVTSCGEPFEFGRSIELPTYDITGENQDGCESNTGIIKIKYAHIGLEIAIVGVRILTAPAAFSHPLPFDATQYILIPISLIEVKITELPAGDYTLEVVDSCGNTYPLSVTVPVTISTALPSYSALRGCVQGLGSVFIDTPNRRFTQVIITNAPSTFTPVLPYNVTFNVSPQGKFYMNELPEGDYIFSTVDVCGISNTFPVIIPGYTVLQSDVTVIGNCGSFNLGLNHVMEQPYMQSFWLQKFNSATNQWVHPFTGVPYANGTIPNATNSYQVYNFSTNYNIATLGSFRILKSNSIYSNGSASYTSCDAVVIKEFEFTGELKITSATTTLCSSANYDVFITVSGIAPFTYTITTKDGLPFFVDNGNSNNFSGLPAGIYNFQVQDVCGNVVNRLFDITTLLEPAISAYQLCNGLNGQLGVPAVSFLSYQWWNGNAPNTILSTTNSLSFSPFYSAAAAGTYYVRIYSTSSLSCIDKVLSYIIPIVSNPLAGNDGAVTLCGIPSPVDLFTLLGGTYDSNGHWEEITTSGRLIGNTWTPNGIPYGIYIFKYHVDGFCNDFDESFVTITLHAIPETPVFEGNTYFCLKEAYQFQVNAIPNAVYDWTGPNGFVANIQNPIIQDPTVADGGIYTVKVLVDGCESSASMNLSAQIPPDFEIDASCVKNAFTVKVVPHQESFDEAAVSYLWSGPNGYLNTENPIQITGLSSGIYSVKVTNLEGCSLSKSLQIGNTICAMVPHGISPNGSGGNEEFDLSGFGEILKFKIFNRYGTMVFEQDYYSNQWHGQDFNDHELPDATYYYYFKLKSGIEKTGWVYVTR